MLGLLHKLRGVHLSRSGERLLRGCEHAVVRVFLLVVQQSLRCMGDLGRRDRIVSVPEVHQLEVFVSAQLLTLLDRHFGELRPTRNLQGPPFVTEARENASSSDHELFGLCLMRYVE